jgi:hypothetical protein
MYRELIFNEIVAFHPELLTESSPNDSKALGFTSNNPNNNNLTPFGPQQLPQQTQMEL